MGADITTAGKLAAYIAALVVVFVLGYVLGGLPGVSGPGDPPGGGVSEMTSTEHRMEGT